MVGFLPTNSQLASIDEFKNLLYTITYTELVNGIETEFPVTITSNSGSSNSTINIIGNKLSGYFSNSFNDVIYYRNINDTFTTVNSFSAINKENLYGLVYFFADGTRSRIYTYTATANGQTKEYTITVTNDWNIGRSNLIRYANIEEYEVLGIRWINVSGSVIPWLNSAGSPVRWIN
jgi:hypothetical protein